MESDLIGRKMEDVALETFTEYQKISQEIAITLVDDPELICKVMNDRLAVTES